MTIINSQKDLLPNKFDLKLSIVDFATVSWTLIKQNTIDDNKIPVVTTTNKEWHSKNHQVKKTRAILIEINFYY